MEILDTEPHGWFLLRDGDELLLDVNCSTSAVGFGMIVRLTPTEMQAHAMEGRLFVSKLAERLQNHALTEFKNRDITPEVGQRVLEAILAARSNGKG